MQNDWQNVSVELVDPSVDIYFKLEEEIDLYDGQITKLSLPNTVREFTNQISTIEALQDIASLTKYFRQIATMSSLPEQDKSQFEHLFWLSLLVRNENNRTVFCFSYYYTLNEILRFQHWVENCSENPHYTDGDQGWEFISEVSKDVIYLYEEDPQHDDHLISNFHTNHSAFNGKLFNACSRAKEIINILSSQLGFDMWPNDRSYM